MQRSRRTPTVRSRPPASPSTLDADEASGVVLTWLAPAGCTPAGYAVYRRNMSEDGSHMEQLATVGGDTLTYTDTDVEAGESYRYRVRSNDLGPRSDHTTIAVPEAAPEPAPRSDDRVVRLADPMFNTEPRNDHHACRRTLRRGTDIGEPDTQRRTADTGDTLTYDALRHRPPASYGRRIVRLQRPAPTSCRPTPP